MDKDERIRRLKTIEGHIRGIERMVEEGAYCIDLIKQIQAAQAALHRVNSEILSDHLHSCLIKAVRGDDPDERERVLKEVAEVYDVGVHPRRR
jgi:DNA-binding FrmR family transcriptional regulator